MATSIRNWLLPDELQRELRVLADGPKESALVERARIVTLSAAGHTADQISAELGVVPLTVYKWRKRFRELGLEGLKDLPRPGQPRKITAEKLAAILRVTRDELPPDSTRWSIRRVAQAAQATEYQVRSVWEEADVGAEKLRLMKLTHELRSSGPSFVVSAVLLAPPCCVAIISVEEGVERGREKARAPVTRQRRGTRARRLGKDSFFRGFDVAQRDRKIDAESSLAEFATQALGSLSDAQSCHVVGSSEEALAEFMSHTSASNPALRTHVLPSVALFLNLLEDLANLLEVRVQSRGVGSAVFELRQAVQDFISDPRNSGSNFSWVAPVQAPARNSDWYELGSGHRQPVNRTASVEPAKSPVGWHSCGSPNVLGNTARAHR